MLRVRKFIDYNSKPQIYGTFLAFWAVAAASYNDGEVIGGIG